MSIHLVSGVWSQGRLVGAETDVLGVGPVSVGESVMTISQLQFGIDHIGPADGGGLRLSEEALR